jgi:hypothetical protein
MMLAQITPPAFILPPTPKIMDYPGLLSVAGVVVFASLMLFITTRYDPSGGALTISLIVVLAFVAVVAFCLLFNIPANDEVTPGVVGALVAAFGAVVAYWLGRGREK